MSVDIIFHVEVKGVIQLKEDIEFNPCITLYTGRNAGSPLYRVPLTDKWQSVRVVVTVTRPPNVQEAFPIFRRHISVWQLNVDGVVSMHTKMHTTVRKNAGAARIDIAHLFLEPGTEHSLPLKMGMLSHGERKKVLPKGNVMIRAASPIMIDKYTLTLDMPRDDIEKSVAQARVQSKKRRYELRGLMAAWQKLFELSPQTFPCAHDINCYIDRLRDGAELPAIAYMMQPPPEGVNVAFFENCLAIVMRRENLTAKEVCAMHHKDVRICNLAVQMLCVWTSHTPYAADESWVPVECEDADPDNSFFSRFVRTAKRHHIEMHHFPMEEFELAEIYNDDDCEGVGWLIVRLHSYLLSTDPATRSPQLAVVCELLSLYVPLLLLCGVTSADLGGDYASLTSGDAQMGAHMFAVFVPLGRMQRMIMRCNRAGSLLANPTAAIELGIEESLDLPILYGEGTGFLLPLPINLPAEKHLLLPVRGNTCNYESPAEPVDMTHLSAKYVPDMQGMRRFLSTTGSSNPVFSNNGLWLTDVMQQQFPSTLAFGARKFFHQTSHAEVAPHFYRTAQLAMTSWFYEHKTSCFSFVFMQRPRGSNDAWKIGCTFADLFNDDGPREVGAWMETPPDETEIAHMQLELVNIPPPPPLNPPPTERGINNTWDPTTHVLTREQHARLDEIIVNIRRNALAAEIVTIRHMIKHGKQASFAGTPHLMSSCQCERALASTEKLDALLHELTRATRNIKDSAQRAPLVCELFFTYEQWLARGDDIAAIVSRPLRLSNVLLLPAGVHITAEHVTADVGGVMFRYYTVAHYE